MGDKCITRRGQKQKHMTQVNLFGESGQRRNLESQGEGNKNSRSERFRFGESCFDARVQNGGRQKGMT